MKGAASGGKDERAPAPGSPTAATTGEHPPTEDPAISAELAVLRKVDPPVALVARVMTKVADRPALTFWQWLRRPFRIEIRMTPLGAIAFAVGLAVGVAMFAAPRLHPWAAEVLKLGGSQPALAPAAGRGSR